MSTFAYRAGLIRQIERTMKRLHFFPPTDDHDGRYQEGQLDAYADVLMLLKGEDEDL